MKKLIFLLLLFISVSAFSQVRFSEIGVGISSGITTSYTGLSYGLSPEGLGTFQKTLTIDKSYVFGVSSDYYFSPFMYAGFEYNKVQLKDGTDKYNRAFISNFSSIEFGGNVALGQFIRYSNSQFLYAIRNLNAGIGVGFINGKNNVADYPDGTNILTPAGPNVPFPRRIHPNDLGKSKFNSVLALPITIGYNFNIYNFYEEARFVIGVQYKMVFTTSDDLDGFADDPTKGFRNDDKDAYTTMGVSLKYLFGSKNLYVK